MRIARRGFLAASAATLAFGGASISVKAAQTDSRFVLVFLRGAMDGLSVVVPYGDPNLRSWRPALVPPEPKQENGLADLGGFWGLHLSLHAMHTLYASNALLPVHCVAVPNPSRSHFEAQDMLEAGADHRLTTGWLNRIAGLMPAPASCDLAFSIGMTPPLILHGDTPTTAWDPFYTRPHVSQSFYDNIGKMHAADARTVAELADGLKERRHVDSVLAGTSYDSLAPGFPRMA